MACLCLSKAVLSHSTRMSQWILLCELQMNSRTCTTALPFMFFLSWILNCSKTCQNLYEWYHLLYWSVQPHSNYQTYFTQGLLSHRMWVADEPGFDRTLLLVFFELLTVVHSPFVSFQFHNVWNATTCTLENCSFLCASLGTLILSLFFEGCIDVRPVGDYCCFSWSAISFYVSLWQFVLMIKVERCRITWCCCISSDGRSSVWYV